MNILVVSGGSGGHINPAIKFIKEIKNHNIVYLGTNTIIEKNKLLNLNIKYYLFNNRGLKKGIYNKLKFFYYLFVNFIHAFKIIKKEKIDKILTFGGYSSSSVFLANLLLKKDIYIHEQNAIIGRNNKIMLRFAKKVFISFQNVYGIKNKYKNKVIYTGNPSFFQKKVDHQPFNILIMTGSLGSNSVTEVLLPLLDKYSNIQLIGGVNNKFKHPKVIDFIDDMEELLSKVDLIITRAGATSINEISSLHIPSIIIPSPYVINNHQEINAKEYLSIKRGYMIKEEDLELSLIINLIEKIKSNKFLYEELSNNAKTFYNKDSIDIIKKEMEILWNI